MKVLPTGSFLRETKIILMCCNEDDANLKLIDVSHISPHDPLTSSFLD